MENISGRGCGGGCGVSGGDCDVVVVCLGVVVADIGGVVVGVVIGVAVLMLVSVLVVALEKYCNKTAQTGACLRELRLENNVRCLSFDATRCKEEELTHFRKSGLKHPLSVKRAL